MSPKILWIATLFLSLVGTAAGQTTAKSFSADLSRYYFTSPEAERAARPEFESALNRLERYKGHLDRGTQLLNAFHEYENVLRLYYKHEAYVRLRCAQNRKDAACDERGKLEAQLTSRTAFLTAEIIALPARRVKMFTRQTPGLQPYQFEIEDIRHNAAHALPAAQQALIDRLHPEIADWQYDLYDTLVSGISFGSVQTASGPLDVIRNRNLIAANPDPQVREEGFKRRMNGYASQRDLLAFALLHTVKAQDALAKAQKYTDAPSRKYISLYLDPAQTRTLLEEMARKGDVAKRFEKIRAADFERAYHSPAHAWDLSAPAPGFSPPITPLPEIPSLYHEVFAGLGPEYQTAFDALLNPANGRADLLPGGAPNRYTSGFSVGFSGSPSILFYGRYDGTFKDLSVIAHEGGHAAHRALMNQSKVKPVYCFGPNFLFESFAEFNELLLADYLAEHAIGAQLQRFYREEWLRIKGLDAFYGAQDALLEQAIYDGVARGSIRNADDLDKLTVQIDGEFSIYPTTTPELRNRWAAVSLMYEDPLYDVNYVYGGLLALKYYQLYTADRQHFVPRYVALLKNGFNAPPDALLKKFLNIDLFSPELLNDDLELLKRRTEQLENGSPH